MCNKNKSDKKREELIKKNKFPVVYSKVKEKYLFLHSVMDNYIFVLSEDNFAILSFAAPAFFYFTLKSMELSMIATITELFNKKTVVGVQTLVKIARENNPKDEKIKEDCESIIRCIKNNKLLLKNLRTARNKVYCHFDLQCLDEQFIGELIKTIQPKEIKRFLNESESYITDLKMHYYKDGRKEILSYMNGPDVDNLIEIIKGADEGRHF